MFLPGAGAMGWNSSSSPPEGVEGLETWGDLEGGGSEKSTLDEMPIAASLSATLVCCTVGGDVERAFWGEDVTWENSAFPEEGLEPERELFIAKLFDITMPVACKRNGH